MFAKHTRRLLRRWNKIVDRYITTSDHFFVVCKVLGANSMKFATQSSIVQPGSNALIKFTIIGLLIALSCVLLSCQTFPRSAHPQVRAPVVGAPRDRGQEMLYVKRDTLNIKPAEPGSKTGSIWADAKQPRQLFNDPRPSRMGEVVTVAIPDELQFKWTPTARSKTSKEGEDKKQADAKPGEAKTGEKPQETAKLSDKAHEKLGDPMQNFYEPLKSMKMEIVAIEPAGYAYLRGSRSFKDINGDASSVAVFAKVAAASLRSFDISATELAEVALSETKNGQTLDYASAGWDTVVSRKLSGFAPDINAEYAALEDVRQELKGAQSSLEERQKSLQEQSERLRKDRDRLLAAEQEFEKRTSEDKAKDGKPEADKETKR